MSVRVMSLVFDRFPMGGSHRLIMLTLADYANDEGGSIHPSVQNIASKAGGHPPTMERENAGLNLSPRRVREILNDLLRDGWLSLENDERGVGGNPQNTTRYAINVHRLHSAQPLRHVAPLRPVAPLRSSVDTPATRRRGGVRPSVQTPATGRTQPTIEPPYNHQEPSLLPKAAGGQARKQSKRTNEPINIGGMILGSCLDTPQFRAAWGEWTQHRSEIGKRLTPTSVKRAIGELIKLGHDGAIAAIQHSVANGWMGIHPPTKTNGAAASNGHRLGRIEAPAGKYAGIVGGTRRA